MPNSHFCRELQRIESQLVLSFESDWLEGRTSFLDHRAKKAKPKQSWISFHTQLQTDLD